MTEIEIKPIETHYAGHRFRSRLEARWAVFFDSLGIKWLYEPQGYVVDGRPYLPDFLVHPNTDLATWFEVKGQYPTNDELAKLAGLTAGTGIRSYLYFAPVELQGPGLSEAINTWDKFFDPVCNVPAWSNKVGWIYNGSEAFSWEVALRPTAFRFDPDESLTAVKRRRDPKSGFWWWTDCPHCHQIVLKLHGMVGWCPSLPEPEGNELPEGLSHDPVLAHETDRLKAAYKAARSARFEHGERPDAA
jgi:hypothetical protein